MNTKKWASGWPVTGRTWTSEQNPKERGLGLLVALICALMFSLPFVQSASANENENFFAGECTISILNQTSNLQPDGRWFVPSIPSNMGPVRARVTCVDNGTVRTGVSDFFTVVPNAMNAIPLIELDTYAPTPTQIGLTASRTELTSAGQTSTLTATASFEDGSSSDVTTSASGTFYGSSNPAIATVSSEGVVTAVSSGRALVTVLNEAVVATIEISVRLSADTDGDGLPDDFERLNGLDPNDTADGFEDPDRDGLTNLNEFDLGTKLRNADTDGDGIGDGEEVVGGADGFITDPLLADTDGDGLNDGLEIDAATDPTDSTSADYAAVLLGITVEPTAITLVKNTAFPAETSQRLTVMGQLIDGSEVDLTARGTNYLSNDLNVANFDTEPGRIFAGDDGSTLIELENSGFVAAVDVDVTTFQPQVLSGLAIPGFTNDIAVADEYAYIAAGLRGLQIVDIGDPANPAIIGELDLPGNANGVAVAGDSAFVAAGVAGVHVVDIATASSPTFLATADTTEMATDIAVRGSTLYVADGSGIAVIDVTDGSAPVLQAQLALDGNARGIDIDGHLAVVAAGTGGVHIVDITDSTSPALLGTTATRSGGISHAAHVVAQDGFAYVADSSERSVGSLVTIDYNVPTTPAVIGSDTNRLGLVSLAVDRQLALAADFFQPNAVPIFTIGFGAPGFTTSLDFSGAPDFRRDNGQSIAIDGSGLVFMVGTKAFIDDNGASGDSYLHIGRYLVLEDTAGIAPDVAITSPAAGDDIKERSSIRLQASATDDILVREVEFSVDGQIVGSDFSEPFDIPYTVVAGATEITVSAIARDTGGNEAEAETIVLPVSPDTFPTVQILGPGVGARFTEGAPVTVTTVATDDISVSSVALKVNGSTVSTDSSAPYTFEITAPTGSSFTLQATATDSQGQKTDSALLVIGLDLNQPPQVDLLQPTDGDEVIEGTTIAITAGATDDLALDRVELTADGTLVGEATEEPYSIDYLVPIGASTVELTLTAYDNLNQTDVATGTLTVIPDPGTEVQGRVTFADGTPAVGATVKVFELTTTTDGAGRFALPGVATVRGAIRANASIETSEGSLRGLSPEAPPVIGSITDVGTAIVRSANFEENLGTNLFQSDDDGDLVTFDQGFTFPYLGEEQTSIYVNSNGNLTFGSRSRTYNPSIPSGVVEGLPRISPLYVDLDPSDGGGVYYNQFPDRLVVTWNAVPVYRRGGSNTLQAILFADGTIQFGFLGLDAITAGNGNGSSGFKDISTAITPGGDPPQRRVDYTVEMPITSLSGEAIYENWDTPNTFDLDYGFMIFRPTGDGMTYDVSYVPTEPTTSLQVKRSLQRSNTRAFESRIAPEQRFFLKHQEKDESEIAELKQQEDEQKD